MSRLNPQDLLRELDLRDDPVSKAASIELKTLVRSLYALMACSHYSQDGTCHMTMSIDGAVAVPCSCRRSASNLFHRWALALQSAGTLPKEDSSSGNEPTSQNQNSTV